MEFLYFLERIRVPGLNECMLLITRLGEETAFLVMALVIFWCVDKRKGYYVLTVGFTGTIFNQFVKLLCRVPRPWVLDPEFSILEQAREAATGYSFPSGHTQSAVGTFGAIAAFTKNKWVRRTCIALCVLVPFSRMYIGVHTPMDVLISVVFALLLILVLRPMTEISSPRALRNIFLLVLALGFGLLAFVELYPFPEDTDLHNLESGLKNAYTLLGSSLGLLVVYPAEEKYVKFETKAVWWAQILKVVLGLLLVLAVKEGLRAPLDAMFAGHMAARAVRYFLIVVTAGIVWPMSFRWFSKLGVNYELRGN